MGGIGSGRHHQGGKNTTSDYRSLDVRRLHREGLLTQGQAFGWNWKCDGEALASTSIRTAADQVILSYRHRCGSDEWHPMEYAVRLDWTACTYGGARPWFLCPADGCGRRVALLYIGRAGLFVCRHCYRLAYDCQRESDDDRATRRAERTRQRMGWEPGILNFPGRRPKGMHRRTFERLQAQHDAFVRSSIAGMAARLRLAEHGLGGLLDDLDVEW
ncbi:hypothetical protein [Thiobaca trueperi]|uniref:Uncharacterized protein n=1 Tax=Thiobaca trueperi TaxID=127458 RepID=A0A4R3MTV4_9GAMM|nr:hypothetical protein [Thiobaca trueperi]TCT19485.1 hypothetical protein EDC35_10891 [Thiobaca trueperi]